MSSAFFEPPPPPKPRPARRRSRTPPWFAPPQGKLPGVVGVELVLARTERVAVCVSRVEAYPEGFALDLVTMGGEDDDELDPLLFEGRRMMRGRRGEAEGIPEEMLRFGVEFADGAKATNTGGGPFDRLCGEDEDDDGGVSGASRTREPAGPVLQAGGGGGGGSRWRQTYWVWPLPPPGRVTFVCEWPAAAIDLTRREVDGAAIVEAAGRAQVLFRESEPDEDDAA